jgi:hypothetical protein
MQCRPNGSITDSSLPFSPDLHPSARQLDKSDRFSALTVSPFRREVNDQTQCDDPHLNKSPLMPNLI